MIGESIYTFGANTTMSPVLATIPWSPLPPDNGPHDEREHLVDYLPRSEQSSEQNNWSWVAIQQHKVRTWQETSYARFCTNTSSGKFETICW